MKRNSLLWVLALCCGSCFADTYVDGVRVQEIKNGVSYQQRVISSVTNGFTVNTNLAYAMLQVGALEVALTKTGTNTFGNTYGKNYGFFTWSLTNSTLAASTWVIQTKTSGVVYAVHTNNGVADSIVDTYSLFTGEYVPWNTLSVFSCTSNDSYVTNYNITIVTNTTPVSTGTVLWFY